MSNAPPPPGGFGFPNAPKDPTPPPEYPPPAPFRGAPPPTSMGGGRGRGLKVGFPILGISVLCVRVLLLCGKAATPSYSYTPPPNWTLPPLPSTADTTDPAIPAAVHEDDDEGPTGGATIVADATSVYWVERGEQMIVKRPKGKDAILDRKILASDVADVGGIASDDQFIYFTVRGTAERAFSDGALERVSKDGGAPTVLAGGLARPTAVAVDGKRAYVILGGTPSSGGGEVASFDLAASDHTQTVLASAQLEPANIAVDKTHVYWTNRLGRTVMRMPKEGTTVQTFASDQEDADALALDGDSVYWSTADAVVKKPKKAPLAAKATVVNDSLATTIGVDGNQVYFVTHHALYRQPKNGKSKDEVEITAGVPGAATLAFDATDVYWSTTDSATSAKKL